MFSMRPEDMQGIMKAVEVFAKFAPFIQVLLKHLPPIEVKELKIGKKEYIALLIPKGE